MLLIWFAQRARAVRVRSRGRPLGDAAGGGRPGDGGGALARGRAGAGAAGGEGAAQRARARAARSHRRRGLWRDGDGAVRPPLVHRLHGALGAADAGSATRYDLLTVRGVTAAPPLPSSSTWSLRAPAPASSAASPFRSPASDRPARRRTWFAGPIRLALAARIRRTSAGVSSRIALQHQRDHAADMGGGDRGSGRDLVFAGRRRHQDVHARRRDRDVVAAVGAGEQPVVDVGGGDRDHVRIGRRVQRRRARPGIAGGRDQDHALVVGRLERALERGIARAGKAHIDDADVVVDRPVEAPEDVVGRALRVRVAGGEGADREDARAGRHAEQLLVRHDRAGHAGAVRMRVVVDAGRVVAVGDGAGEIGMGAVDLGVDHADRDVVARARCGGPRTGAASPARIGRGRPAATSPTAPVSVSA